MLDCVFTATQPYHLGQRLERDTDWKMACFNHKIGPRGLSKCQDYRKKDIQTPLNRIYGIYRVMDCAQGVYFTIFIPFQSQLQIIYISSETKSNSQMMLIQNVKYDTVNCMIVYASIVIATVYQSCVLLIPFPGFPGFPSFSPSIICFNMIIQRIKTMNSIFHVHIRDCGALFPKLAFEKPMIICEHGTDQSVPYLATSCNG